MDSSGDNQAQATRDLQAKQLYAAGNTGADRQSYHKHHVIDKNISAFHRQLTALSKEDLNNVRASVR